MNDDHTFAPEMTAEEAIQMVLKRPEMYRLQRVTAVPDAGEPLTDDLEKLHGIIEQFRARGIKYKAEHMQDAKAALTAAGVAPQEPSLSNSEILERIAEQEREAAGAPAPQVPNQNETKSGNNFVSLDPEKVADVLNDHDYMYYTSACKCLWTGPGSHQAHQSEALCEAYTEGKLT